MATKTPQPTPKYVPTPEPKGKTRGNGAATKGKTARGPMA